MTARRLPFAYPIYQTGYEAPFTALDEWAASLPRFLTFGRHGLFAHDNTHHALAMAYAMSRFFGMLSSVQRPLYASMLSPHQSFSVNT